MKKLFVVLFALVMFASCKNETVETETKEDKLNTEYLGIVGKGEIGSFRVFRFEIDNVTYIVGSEYKGGMALIDKIEK